MKRATGLRHENGSSLEPKRDKRQKGKRKKGKNWRRGYVVIGSKNAAPGRD